MRRLCRHFPCPSTYEGRNVARTAVAPVASLLVAAMALTVESAAVQVSYLGQRTSDVVVRDGSVSGRVAADVCTSASFMCRWNERCL